MDLIELLAKALEPLIKPAIAVGGLIYPTRYFITDRAMFFRLYACIIAGIGVGLASDWSIEGASTGAAIGAVGLPALTWVRNKFNPEMQAAVRTEEKNVAAHVEREEGIEDGTEDSDSARNTD